MYKISPFVKWAGGKTQLLDEIISRLPETYDRYYEPFAGGGAVLFGIQPRNAHINDINSQLINVYRRIKEDPEKIISCIKKLDGHACDKEYYYKNRKQYNTKIERGILDEESAALFIWLNKHCFNGLYRVNKDGLFNVPYNNRTTGDSINEENIRNISLYLQHVEICNLDFADFCKDVQKGDFVYFDSPYVPESKTADFTAYTEGGFGLEEHKRLARLYRQLDKKGAKLMLSNNGVKLIYELYSGYNIDKVDAKRMINSKSEKRVGREVLITNYETPYCPFIVSHEQKSLKLIKGGCIYGKQ